MARGGDFVYSEPQCSCLANFRLTRNFFPLMYLPMKLDDWLAINNEKRSAFAARLGTSAGYVTDLCQGKAWPRMKMAQRIMAATGGKVRPEDFFNSESVAE